MNLFSHISQINHIAAEERRIKSQKEELTKPLVTDKELIPLFYTWYKTFVPGDSVDSRLIFIYCISFLYCPRFSAGGKIERGLREEINKIFPDVCGKTISKYIVQSRDYFTIYKYFQRETEEALIYLMEIHKIRTQERD